MKLWLDDWRPAPDGWHWAKDVATAKALLEEHEFDEASLDHDLGACAECLDGKTVEEWIIEHDGQSAPHCDHVGTGYDLVMWMVHMNRWPKTKPRVHSLNPVGRERMEKTIDRYFGS